MTTMTRKVKAEKILSHSARATFKATGAIVYAVIDNGVTYHTTSLHGKVRGCVNTSTGRDCRSFMYRGYCSHSAYVDRKETERQEQLAVAAAVAPVVLGEAFAQDLEQHVEDDIRTSAFVDPFAGMTREQKRLAYRDMYPDDFEYSAA